MIYRRSYSQNILGNDSYIQKKTDVDRLNEEIIKVTTIGLFTTEGTYFVNDMVANEVIESNDYFTIIYKKNIVVALKYHTVYKVEFELLV